MVAVVIVIATPIYRRNQEVVLVAYQEQAMVPARPEALIPDYPIADS
jgi:hypothetical protein